MHRACVALAWNIFLFLGLARLIWILNKWIYWESNSPEKGAEIYYQSPIYFLFPRSIQVFLRVCEFFDLRLADSAYSGTRTGIKFFSFQKLELEILPESVPTLFFFPLIKHSSKRALVKKKMKRRSKTVPFCPRGLTLMRKFFTRKFRTSFPLSSLFPILAPSSLSFLSQMVTKALSNSPLLSHSLASLLRDG